MGGPEPIGYAALDHWQNLAGVRLTLWETDTLIAIDSAVRTVLMESTNDGNTDQRT